jgi:dTMP kinase
MILKKRKIKHTAKKEYSNNAFEELYEKESLVNHIKQQHKSGFRNPFIVFEGVNGAGKSTVVASVKKRLSDLNISCVVTQEPGGTIFGQHIRSLILNRKDAPLDSITEALLFTADRREHILNVIQPSLIESKASIVPLLCDRFYMSFLAFQGYGRGIDLEYLKALTMRVVENYVPTLIILLDIEPETGLKRILKERSTSHKNAPEEEVLDSIEREKIEFHQHIRNGYLELASTTEEPCLIVEASQSQECILEEVLSAINYTLKCFNEEL